MCAAAQACIKLLLAHEEQFFLPAMLHTLSVANTGKNLETFVYNLTSSRSPPWELPACTPRAAWVQDIKSA